MKFVFQTKYNHNAEFFGWLPEHKHSKKDFCSFLGVLFHMNHFISWQIRWQCMNFFRMRTTLLLYHTFFSSLLMILGVKLLTNTRINNTKATEVILSGVISWSSTTHANSVSILNCQMHETNESHVKRLLWRFSLFTTSPKPFCRRNFLFLLIFFRRLAFYLEVKVFYIVLLYRVWTFTR